MFPSVIIIKWIQMSELDSLEELTLPTTIPIFDLPRTVLLPRAHLPLIVEDRRFKSLVEDAFKNQRLVGIVQHMADAPAGGGLFRSGCLGKITTFNEGDEGQYFVVVSGLIRFLVTKEVKTSKEYRRVQVLYEPFLADLAQPETTLYDRVNLIALLKDYLSIYDITPNWEEIEAASDDYLITSLTMVCPFEPQEKQALLECVTLDHRFKIMTALMEMAFLQGSNQHWVWH